MNKIFNIVIIGCLIFSLGGVASAAPPIYLPRDTRSQDLENSIMNAFQIYQAGEQQRTSEKMTTFMMLKELRETKKAEQMAPATALATIIKQVAQRQGIEPKDWKVEDDDWNKYTEQEKHLWGEKADEYNKLQAEIDEIEDAMRELAGLKKKEKK